MSRGDQRDDIFFDDADRYDFITTLGEACLKTDWWPLGTCNTANARLHRAMKKRSARSDTAQALMWK
jgi:hypothetical protein